MVSVSDILKILDKVPIWQTLTILPKRVEAREVRVAELEVAAAQARSVPKSSGERCPGCGEHQVFRISSTPATGRLGNMGLRDEVWTCKTCGQSDERKKTPE